MFSLIQIKLLALIVALLATMIGYTIYQYDRQHAKDQQEKQFLRPMRPDEKAAQPKGWADALRKH